MNSYLYSLESINWPQNLRRILLIAGCFTLLGLASCTPEGPAEPVTDEQSAATQSEQATKFMKLGESLRSKGDLVSAAEMFRRAARADSRSPLPPAALGDVLRRLKQYTEAEQAFREALGRNPYSGTSLQGYGILMVEQGQADAAIAALSVAVDEEAADHRVYNMLGIAYDTLGDHAQAQSHYLAGLAQAPDNRSLRNNMAISLALQERYDAAIEQVRQLAEAEDADQSLRHNLALIYGLSGQIEKASKLLRTDLSEADVANNLSFYQSVRALSPDDRRKAVLDTVLKSLFQGSGNMADKPSAS